MGIVNLSPDSFSGDGTASLERALAMAATGADWLDVGGESTRPGARRVSEDEELSRVIPAIEALRAQCATPISIDTMKPAVARAAIGAGATMWNDVTALGVSRESLDTAAALGCQVVLMHMQGEPATMQDDPRYGNVLAEVTHFLAQRARAAEAAGVDRERIWLDPGIGFGKTLAHNLALLRGLGDIVALGFPVLVGASRKGMIRLIDKTATDTADRLGGSLAIALAAARAGAAMVRVHDVRETLQALAVGAAIRG
ncbi:MAG TPA: dihydropteroate synthase [Caulobacteraceae bacterium]|jgi:dihydropteroate synthase